MTILFAIVAMALFTEIFCTICSSIDPYRTPRTGDRRILALSVIGGVVMAVQLGSHIGPWLALPFAELSA